ncbi:PREDICTED: LOW QUALITY PROTEIN: uncharacterized protein LOC105146162 [Acromyrmex echinatior]|uniref:LOW QUALITY PROTEIN: uncharacterized protein LOC105146162 n=1 Tax=Acromyrmex echinatior TaxID=103372 RepID=UPI000580F2EF|nr:PREDICTED: LOW QUALITY PROTEIN: uncharacterized protein LOC105146162 [Acromyrmex echinatior]
MSKTENSDLTAEKDAPPMEMIRTDCADNTAIIIAVKSTNVMWEDPLAPVEVAKEVLNAQFENKYLIEAKIDTNVLGEKEIDNPDIYIKETTDIITHVPAHVSVKDVNVTQVKAQNYAESEEVLQPKFINEEKVDTSKQNARDNIAAYISRLEAEVRKRTKERDSYQKKFEDAKTKLAALQAYYTAIMNRSNDKDTLQQPALMYEERNRVIANQENQINALNNQVASLKEVISVTRDLLEIRNIEVKQLQAEVDNMEKKISEERDRHNTMISKMDAAMQLNADLKKEYETQLFLFQSLREKYNKKIILLSREKQILETVASAPK